MKCKLVQPREQLQLDAGEPNALGNPEETQKLVELTLGPATVTRQAHPTTPTYIADN